MTAARKRSGPYPIPVQCTLFNGVRPAVREAREPETWEAFVSNTLPDLVAERRRAKKNLTGFVLAAVNGRRSDATVGAHTALAIDVDEVPDNDLGALLKRASRLRCAVYETPSSREDLPRVRVIAALPAPIEPSQVQGARRALAEELDLDPDRCGTAGALPASQVMFVGRVTGTRERGLWRYDGALWCPPVAAATPRRKERRASIPTQQAPRALPADAFDFGAVPDLDSIAKAVPPAGHNGDRHLLVRGLGGWLSRRGYDPEAIAEAVRLQIPSDDPAERAAQAKDAAERVRRGDDAPGWEALSAWAERYAKGASTLGCLERACRDPREPVGFDGVWSEWWAAYWPRFEQALRDRWRAANDVGPRVVTDGEGGSLSLPGGAGELDGTGMHVHPLTGWPWILQRDGSFWLHRVESRSYRDHEIRASELVACIARDLAGLVPEGDRSLETLRNAWIRPVKALRATYTARDHGYDPATNTLTLAALRWANLNAKRHAHIDRWLRALFGKGYAAAAQWLAALVVLDRPAPCLYLPGPRRLGKSLLADGLAALWNRPSPVDMGDAIKDFNQSTGECPLIFTDEGFPEGLSFNAFKKMITAHSRSVNAKYRAPLDVEGCGRFLIAANDEDVLRYQKIGTLSKDSLDAIADRLLVVPCHAAAEAEVKRIDTRAAAHHEIAEHVLWLTSTVDLEPQNERMAAKPGGGERILANVVAGRSAEILGRVREALGTGAMGERSGVLVPKRAAKSEVWINISRLHATFDGRVALTTVKEVCDSLQLRPGTEQRNTTDGHNLKWRVLDRARLNDAFAKLD
jgi:hypothetical protein